MKIIKTIKDMREYSRRAHRDGKTIGLVPTMGHLHDGHMSLVRAAKKECDAVVVSIFVNPAQFGPAEDLDKYPRNIRKDKKMCGDAGVDAVFVPSAAEIYPEGYSTYVDVAGDITSVMCGAVRPGHFKGVATVVTKLFNIVRPDVSYFGQKDSQQAAVIKKLAEDLVLDTRIRVMPIVREKDGLAMSSRNIYLSASERGRALAIYRALRSAKKLVKSGECSVQTVKRKMLNMLKTTPALRVDYVEIVDGRTLGPVKKITKGAIIAVAAVVGKTRLIDNVIVRSVKRKA